MCISRSFIIFATLINKDIKMILANITSFHEGEHFYCSYIKEDFNPNKKYLFHPGSYSSEQLKRIITDEKEAKYLNKKDGYNYNVWKIGDETIRFNSIEDINNTLKQVFKDEDCVISYYEGYPFKEMIYVLIGIDLGYKGLGDVWLPIPSSCWKDLLPPIEEIKVRCSDCGHEFNFKDIIVDEFHYEIENRTLVNLMNKKSKADYVCCKYYSLEWNVIL